MHRDEIVLLLHEPRYVQRLCFFTCKQLWITKKWKRRGWVEKKGREGGREGDDHKIVSYALLSAGMSGPCCCCFNLLF